MTEPAARLKENQVGLSHADRIDLYGDELADILEAVMATADDEPADALTEDECAAINADGRDGRGWITESNLTATEASDLYAYRTRRDA